MEATDPLTSLGAGLLLLLVGLGATVTAAARVLRQDVVSVIGTQ